MEGLLEILFTGSQEYPSLNFVSKAVKFWVDLQFVSNELAYTRDYIGSFFCHCLMKAEVIGLCAGSRDGAVDGVEQFAFYKIGI